MARPRKDGSPSRVRRGFATILIDKLKTRYEGKVEPEKLVLAIEQVEQAVQALENAKVEKKNNFKALKKFSREEIEAYLETLKE